MATSKLLEVVAEVAAEAKWEHLYSKGGKSDVEALKAFLVKLWGARKHEMFDEAKMKKNDCLQGYFRLNFNLPEGLAFDADTIKDVLCENVDDFQGLGPGKVIVKQNDGEEEHDDDKNGEEEEARYRSSCSSSSSSSSS